MGLISEIWISMDLPLLKNSKSGNYVLEVGLGVCKTKKRAKLKFGFTSTSRPTSGEAVLRSKLVDERCRVQFLIALVSLAILSFP